MNQVAAAASDYKKELRKRYFQEFRACIEVDSLVVRNQYRLIQSLCNVAKRYWRAGSNVLVYDPLKSEVDWLNGLLKASFALEKIHFFLPHWYTGGRMDFRSARLIKYPGRGKLRVEKNYTVLPRKQIDFILVPGLYIDRSGYRLGRGGGFYDRFLCQIAKEKTWFLALDWQMKNSLPVEKHDIRIGNIITESGVFRTYF